jgi:hypothetical protein
MRRRGARAKELRRLRQNQMLVVTASLHLVGLLTGGMR